MIIVAKEKKPTSCDIFFPFKPQMRAVHNKSVQVLLTVMSVQESSNIYCNTPTQVINLRSMPQSIRIRVAILLMQSVWNHWDVFPCFIPSGCQIIGHWRATFY